MLRVKISPELFARLLTTGYSPKGNLEVVSGLPAGCTLEVVKYRGDVVELIFSHPDYEGQVIECPVNIAKTQT